MFILCILCPQKISVLRNKEKNVGKGNISEDTCEAIQLAEQEYAYEWLQTIKE
jgi:hypothetical protein